MKTFTSLKKIGFLVLATMAFNLAANATTYTANTSGDFSNSATWIGGTAPSFNISGADNIVINAGVIVNLNGDLTLNNALAALVLNGTLSGAGSLNMQTGGLSGTGTLHVHNLTMGGASSLTYTGVSIIDNLYNYLSPLTLGGNTQVIDTLGLYSGTTLLSTGVVLTLSNNATINIGNGYYNIGSGTINLLGSIDLLYTGSADSSNMGGEISLTNIRNITIDLAADSNQLNMMRDLVVTGQLSLQNGYLSTNGYNLTINGTISTGTFGALRGSATTNLNINGYGNVGTLGFGIGYAVTGKLNMNIGGPAGFINLSSDLTVEDTTRLVAGTLMLNNNNLTANGYLTGYGLIGATASSGLRVNGSDDMGGVHFAAGYDTIGNLTLNIMNNGSLALGTNLTVAGLFTVTASRLIMYGMNLTLTDTVRMIGGGSLTGNDSSDLILGGIGYKGVIFFTAGMNMLHNLTMNVSGGGGVTFGTDVNVTGTLNLANGLINLSGANNLNITGTDSILGGSTSSYVATNGSGSLVMHIATSDSSADYVRKFAIGTQNNYAPVTVSNSSVTSGNFRAQAHPGIFANGTSGGDLSLTKSSVNTSWNVESDVTNGPNMTLEAFWSQGMEVNSFNESNVRLSHFTNSAWDSIGGAYATAHASGMLSVRRSAITSFSPFAVFSSPGVATGVKEAVSTTSFMAYPVPAQNSIIVAINSPLRNHELKLYDILGNQVAAYTVYESNNTIDISHLTSGVYFLSLNNTYTQKIIKQ